jgi:RNA polymerase sigma factor (sigma-70 family)
MAESVTSATNAPGTAAQFGQTQWSVVLAAADQQAPGAAEALEQLCCAYWYPLYAFLRRSGRQPHDAQDLVQGFFVHLLEKESRLKSARPNRGKFRTFLLTCLKHYVADEQDKAMASRRHPGQPLLSIDQELAEDRYRCEPADVTDPARIFERRWAFAVVEQTLNQLRESCANEGKADLFDALAPFLTGNAERGDYVPVAARFGMSDGSVRTEVSRLRVRYRDLLMKEIARTLDDPADVDAEVRDLFALFSR